jgi:hypothetical protein
VEAERVQSRLAMVHSVYTVHCTGKLGMVHSVYREAGKETATSNEKTISWLRPKSPTSPLVKAVIDPG